MLAIFVTIKVKPGRMEEFVEASLADARGSVGDEPGCYRFDVLRDSEDDSLAHLYEIYEDAAARETHRTMPHFLAWRAAVADLIEGDYKIVEMSTEFPPDATLRGQKPHLMG